MKKPKCHKEALDQVARKIEGLLSELILLQRDHVAVVCSACDNPCCGRVEHLFDEKDMIYAKVFLGQEVPRRKRKRSGGCAFLSANGCRLAPQARPFTCHRYICSELEAGMTRKEPGLPQILDKKFRAVEALRGQLWREYL
ncbi:MAG: hypothetical protein PVH99_13940 [Desulfobacteraceae bacterium]|jgi:hypothetical protein